jgi:hypothetical protein
MTGMGHFDPFLLRRLNGRCPFSQPTSAGASGNGSMRRFRTFPASPGTGRYSTPKQR